MTDDILHSTQYYTSPLKLLLELHNFYKRNVSYVTTYIIRSDYYSVTDKFKFITLNLNSCCR